MPPRNKMRTPLLFNISVLVAMKKEQPGVKGDVGILTQGMVKPLMDCEIKAVDFHLNIFNGLT